MIQSLRIPYGSRKLEFEIPARQLAGVFAPRPVAACPNPDQEIQDALENPLGGLPLTRQVQAADSVVILIDDYTRPTPAAAVLPHILSRLGAAGVKDERITLLVASGAHRPCRPDELARKVGPQLIGRLRIVQHDCRDESQQAYLGLTRRGTPVWVNRLVVETERLIGIGHIDPSTFAGYAGGRKLIVPGVAALETIDANHSLVPVDFRNQGDIDAACRQDIEEAGAMVRADIFINLILNQQGDIARVFAGSPEEVYRKGVEFARQVYEVECPANLDAAIAAGYPYEVDFYQACRAFQFAEKVVKPGGSIILAAPCKDGIGSREFFDTLTPTGRPPHAYLRAIVRRNGKVTYNVLGYFLSRIMAEKSLFMVTGGIPAHLLSQIGVGSFSSLQDAVEQMQARYGEDMQVAVFPAGSATLPRFIH